MTSYSSCMTLKGDGKNAGTAAWELGVRYLLEAACSVPPASSASTHR